MDEDTEIAILDDSRHSAAALFGASPDRIAIATSFTEALNQVAWWLRPGRGQNIVSSEVDFPSVTYPWHRTVPGGLEQRGGDQVPDPTRGKQILRGEQPVIAGQGHPAAQRGGRPPAAGVRPTRR